MKIAYFGGINSHTYSAADDFVKKGFIPSVFSAVPKAAIKDCFKAVAFEECAYSVIPLENSVEGSVTETLDCLLEFPVYIAASVIKPIRQNLIVYRGAGKGDIKQIYSHPQALSQCRKYLENNFPNAEVIAAKSTSDGISRVTDKSVAAIGKMVSGEEFAVLEEGIQDYPDNATEFALLSPRPSFAGGKCSIIFDTLNEPGALLTVLKVLADESINMTKIVSRPAKTTMGRYVFFTDFMFPGDKKQLDTLLNKLSQKTGFIKFLGKY